jgi:phytoene desaturase (3,4-didehydrolycopene-forming)
MQRSWQRATGPDTLLARPNFYVHVPNRTDPTAAPAGCESVMVLMPVANMQEVG